MPSLRTAPGRDLVCWSHLRWDFVFQRPQHIMRRLARDHRVFFVEEPLSGGPTRLDVREDGHGVSVVVPFLEAGLPEPARDRVLADSFTGFFGAHGIEAPIAWYYTPMFLGSTRHLDRSAVVYDCMDELSAFAGAPPALGALEAELLACADVVFTGGYSLYEAKRPHHPNVHPFPSSVDVAHFARARTPQSDPPDQAGIPRPRLGFFGVIDERMDLALLAGIADARPDWHLVIVGPVVKIDPAVLPRRANIHYLGSKTYDELPGYLSGWDVALLPFALNEATRFISPTKTPEYMAGGRPVVSTPIRDIVEPYGVAGLVQIASDAPGFVRAVERALVEDPAARLRAHDGFLQDLSWDETVDRMRSLMVRARREPAPEARRRASGE